MSRLGERPVDVYLRYWRAFAWLMTGALALVVITRLPDTRHRARRFLCDSPGVGLIGVVGFGMWFGTLAGLAEAFHLTGWFFIERHPSRVFDWEFVWMAAPAAALAFVVLAAALLVAMLAVPRGPEGRSRPSLKLVTLVFSFVAIYSVLEAPRLRLAPLAVMFLSLGLATLLSRKVGAQQDRFRRLVRRSSGPLLALVAGLITLGVWNLPSLQERRRVAGLERSGEGLPNIILIILDTVRAKSLSLYGYDKPTTPRLESWAAKGVVFENAFSTAPWTLPSHASLFTGRWPHEHSGDYRSRLDGTHPTLAERLSELGYHTVGYTANFPNTSSSTGLARGFARYEDYHIGWGPFLQKSFSSRLLVSLLPIDRSGWRMGAKSATQNTDDVARWLSKDRERPFFLFVNYFDAHNPYVSPRRYRDRFPALVEPLLMRRAGVTEADLAGTNSLYDAAICYIDEEVDRLLNELQRRGMLDDAVIVIASDHGEAMGEHGLQFHGNHLYTPIIRVPLIVIGPGRVPTGVRVQEPVSIRDVGATLLDLVADTETVFPGRSMASLWDRSSPGGAPRVVLAQISPSWNTAWQEGILRSIVFGDYQYFRHPDGRRELYDLRADPHQANDLSSSTTHRGLLEELDARLDSVLAGGTPLGPASSLQLSSEDVASPSPEAVSNGIR